MIEKDINIKLVFADIGVNGLITDDNEGNLIIAINNSQKSQTEQLVTVWHELTHVLRGDLERTDATSAELEKECAADMVRAAERILQAG